MDHALAFDSTTDTGRNILAVFLEAKASGLRITGFGTGRCMLVDEKVVEAFRSARAS